MREIKFRAWDKVLKYFLNYENYVDMDGGIWEEAKKKYNTPNTEIEPVKEVILMQYTGLKDKNRKEIFEGDIVKAKRYSKSGVIEWATTCWAIGVETPIGHRAYHIGSAELDEDNITRLDKHEIIGNIHENPELVKGGAYE